ncbi:hypothetical protein LY76DRAFT_288221 [Colletotrichum caudatum]|nr:hypothetical protein LY76DRAFT_288221 [Colletotrichum caudatum]
MRRQSPVQCSSQRSFGGVSSKPQTRDESNCNKNWRFQREDRKTRLKQQSSLAHDGRLGRPAFGSRGGGRAHGGDGGTDGGQETEGWDGMGYDDEGIDRYG